MKRLTSLFTTMMVMMVALLSTSCQPKEDAPDEPSLSLSTQAIAVPNEGGAAPAINVTTNQATWQAIAGADWIQTTQQGNSLIITAKPNQGNADRTAEVGVYAGAATPQKITVTQTAADVVLEVSPDELVIPNTGATKLIKVKSNANNWTLDVEEADWVTINTFTDFAELVVAPNEGEAREAKLYAKSASQTKEIVVKQAGVSVAKWPTPAFMGYNEKLKGYYPEPYDIMRFEADHGSFLLEYAPASPGLPSWGIPPSGAQLTFVTSSKIMPNVGYSYNYDKGHLEFITYVTTMPIEELLKSDYKEFLTNELGFKVTDEKEGEYIKAENEKTGFTALVTKGKDGMNVVQFTSPTPPDPEQPKPMPTFDKLPLGDMIPHLFTKTAAGWKLEDVQKWETANGGKMGEPTKDKEENIKYVGFDITTAEHLSMRQYWFLSVDDAADLAKYPTHKLELRHLGYTVDNIDYVFWKDDRGKYYLTKEFKALMKDAGYELIAKQGETYWFQKDNAVMGWQRVQYKDFADSRLVLNNQAYLDLDNEGDTRYMTAQDKMKLAEKWSKALGM